MPVKPSYCKDLRQGIDVLSQLQTEWVGRKDLEVALGISKTVAWRLLRHCGAILGPGGALSCRRLELIAQLERLLSDGGKVEFEVRRRERLDAYLTKIRPQVIANRTKIVPDRQAAAIINSRFNSLPGNINLTGNSLHIRFDGSADFLSAIGALVYALNNDYEAINRFLERQPVESNDRTSK